MTTRKYNSVARQCKTAKFPRTFEARLADIPEALLDSMTAAQIAAMIDGPMAKSYSAGQSSVE